MFLRLRKKYLKLLRSSSGLGFSKNYHKHIKAICEKNKKDFQCWAFLSFKAKSVTQVFIPDIQAKIWKSLYSFIFVWICIYFSAYKFLICVFVSEYIKNEPNFYGKYTLMKITWEFLWTRMWNSFLFFKTKSVTDMQVKEWRSLYAFIFVWIRIHFSVYKYLSGVTVKECVKN